MPVPKRKRSRARRDSRFANKKIAVKALVLCSNCQHPQLPHQACRECGFYKGAKIINTKSDRGVKRLEIRAKQKTEAQRDESQAAQ
ncbi:MAG: 50S ribosomal protein L32 [Candidatus Dependentiae bacterium ADurb.Bin331]|nr:MAG: 50S ribosomal protein L32 [Candidatus Dependentiae bacterium ADurb.Bin331]